MSLLLLNVTEIQCRAFPQQGFCVTWLILLSFFFSLPPCSSRDDPSSIWDTVGQFLLCRQQARDAQQGRLFIQWRTLSAGRTAGLRWPALSQRSCQGFQHLPCSCPQHQLDKDPQTTDSLATVGVSWLNLTVLSFGSFDADPVLQNFKWFYKAKWSLDATSLNSWSVCFANGLLGPGGFCPNSVDLCFCPQVSFRMWSLSQRMWSEKPPEWTAANTEFCLFVSLCECFKDTANFTCTPSWKCWV